MSYGGGGAAAAAHAALVQAVKASGVLIRLEPDEFLKILGKNRDGLVVIAQGGFLNRGFRYITSYKGLAFFTKSSVELELPGGMEIVDARQIWMPS
ncbi:MAG: hypothetical protein FWE97_00165 [Dehalococcoidia bacterium]|nr:hypothetical protein [Dehalococcoidia bacterium]